MNLSNNQYPDTVVCLYSKFSPNCKRFMSVASQKIPILKFVCIDNEKLRKRIIEDMSVKVEYVPCVLVIFKGGVIEKFDGEHAFRWAAGIIQKIDQTQPPPQPMGQPVGQPPPQPMGQPVGQPVGQQPQPMGQQPPQPMGQQPQQPVGQPPQPMGQPPQPMGQPVGQKSTYGTSIIEELADEDEPADQEKNINKSIKKDNGILAMANQLASAREQEESQMVKPRGLPNLP